MGSINKFIQLKKAQRRQYWKPEKLNEYQLKRLREILKFSYETIPFYHERFKKFGLNPRAIKSLKDLKKIPILTKKEIKDNYEKIINPKIDISKARVVPTCGSTGIPLKMVYDTKADDFSKAINLRSHIENGLRFNKKWAIIGDYRTVPSPNIIQKFGIFRIYYINLIDDVHNQIKTLSSIKPDFLTGYPSQIKIISEELKKSNIDLSIETVFTTAELLDDETREIIHNSLNSDVIDLFGCIEVNRTAWECKKHMGYHMDIDSVVIEFIRDNEEVTTNDWGDIIYTSLYNYAMPLIRYDVGDRGIPSDEQCTCGRTLPLMKKVVGRKDDFIKLGSGIILSPITFHVAIRQIVGIKEVQIVQSDIKTLEIEIVGDNNFSPITVDTVQKKIREICGESINLKVYEVKHIQREKSSKIRMVKSKV